MTILSFGGGLSMKEYSLTRDPLWLVATYTAYSGSNIMAILLIDQTGLARAMVMASASSIVFFTAAGVFYGERLNAFHFTAAGLALCAIVLVFAGDQHAANPSTSTQITEENVDA
jgi:drug/metabolite transporter (DMT)-like permease